MYAQIPILQRAIISNVREKTMSYNSLCMVFCLSFEN